MPRIRKFADKLIPESVFRLLSYFVVIPGRRIQSSVNGRLEINYANGKKMLDSANTNYSYGSLQQVLRFGLKKMDLSGVSSVLVLGLGGGSVIGTLRRDFGFQGHITGVDVDPVMISLASAEYGLNEDRNLKMVCNDAMHFLQVTDQRFALIVIDLFIDKNVPQFVFDRAFVQGIHSRLTGNGQFMLNAGFDHQKGMQIPFINELSSLFPIEVFSGPGGVNKLIIGRLF